MHYFMSTIFEAQEEAIFATMKNELVRETFIHRRFTLPWRLKDLKMTYEEYELCVRS